MSVPRPALLVAAIAACLAMAAPRSSAGAEDSSLAAPSASADSTTDLRPTSSVPWNPPRAVSNHETWEQVLNAPLTLVSLPFRALGALTEAGLLRVQEDRLVPRVQYGIAVTRKSGINLGPADLGVRPGFGAALTYAPPRSRGWLRASVAGTFRRYHGERVELGPRWLFASYGHDWRPQEPFYGIGAQARESDVSNYAMRADQAELQARLRAGSRVRREVGAWIGARQSVLRSGREAGRPTLETTFPQVAAGTLEIPQYHWIVGARAALDTRSGRPHWSRGWRLEAGAERFAPQQGGIRVFSGDDDSPGFHRFTLAGQVGWSFMRDPRTLRLSGRVVDVEPFDQARPPAPFDLPHLGSSAGLAGFEPGRFHGLDLLLVKLDYIFPLVEYAELELSAEVGAVSGDVWRETRVDRLERSYGVLIRPRTHRVPLGAFGVCWSHEGSRVRYSLGGVE